MKYVVIGYGRRVGALGLNHPFYCLLEADSLEGARLAVYQYYEHCSDLEVWPEPDSSEEVELRE